jgi:hypothetical protein
MRARGPAEKWTSAANRQRSAIAARDVDPHSFPGRSPQRWSVLVRKSIDRRRMSSKTLRCDGIKPSGAPVEPEV